MGFKVSNYVPSENKNEELNNVQPQIQPTTNMPVDIPQQANFMPYQKDKNNLNFEYNSNSTYYNLINNRKKGFRISSEIYEITSGSKQDLARKNLVTQREIEVATQGVLASMTTPTGTPEEIAAHNDMLTRCVIGDKIAQDNVKRRIEKIIVKDMKLVPEGLKSQYLVDYIYRNHYGLGPIEDLVNDPSINEVFVNSYDHVWIEKNGKKTRIESEFKSDEDVMRIIRLLLQFNHQDISIQDPMKESRMLNGSRITILIPPASKHPTICIRKFDAFEVSTDNLIQEGTINQEMADVIQKLVSGRANMMLIGETGAGKTSLLKWLIGLMDEKLRIGTIETNFELKVDEKFPERNIISYEEHLELGVTMSALFKKMLRSSPDVIICGEARGAEADDMIHAFRRGHPGSIGTMHTNSVETMVDDICEMINDDGKNRDPKQLRYRVASSIHFVIQIRRCDDGVRRLVRLSEVIPNPETLDYEINDIFVFDQDKEVGTKGVFKKIGKISDKTKEHLIYHNVPASTLVNI